MSSKNVDRLDICNRLAVCATTLTDEDLQAVIAVAEALTGETRLHGQIVLDDRQNFAVGFEHHEMRDALVWLAQRLFR